MFNSWVWWSRNESTSSALKVVSFICLCLLPDRAWHKVNDSKVDYCGDLGRWRSGASRGSIPACLCWSSTHLVKCGPEEPTRSWTQIWVQDRMPDYSLNWIARSSAIQEGQRFQCCNSPTRRWPSQSWRPFGLESVIDFNTPSSMNARRSS